MSAHDLFSMHVKYKNAKYADVRHTSNTPNTKTNAVFSKASILEEMLHMTMIIIANANAK